MYICFVLQRFKLEAAAGKKLSKKVKITTFTPIAEFINIDFKKRN